MNFIEQNGSAKILKKTNLRKGQPSTQGGQKNVVKEIPISQIVEFVGWVIDGENVSGNSKWFKTKDGNYFWSGNVEIISGHPKISEDYRPITVQQLCSIVLSLSPAKADEFETYLNKATQEFLINTPIRQAIFISQAAHESGGYNFFVENLNYSADALLRTWPKRFTRERADLYARQPQKIANYVYANRNGNGVETSGDGWKYRGRGVIQITGRENYKNCGIGLNLDLITSPELLEQPLQAFRSGAWFWNSRKLNELADKDDFLGITKVINGGLNGLEDRKKYYTRAKAALGIA